MADPTALGSHCAEREVAVGAVPILCSSPGRIVSDGFRAVMTALAEIRAVAALTGAAIEARLKAVASQAPELGVLLRGFLLVTEGALGIGVAEIADVLIAVAVF